VMGYGDLNGGREVGRIDHGDDSDGHIARAWNTVAARCGKLPLGEARTEAGRIGGNGSSRRCRSRKRRRESFS